MKFKLQKSILTTLCISSFLAACGGGGDDNPAPPKYTRNDIARTAGAGIAVHLITGARTAFLPNFFGAMIQSLAADTGGSRTLPLTCTSGSGSLQLSKATPHVGLTVGDALKLTFNNCMSDLGTVNGSATLTLRNTVAPVTTPDFNAQFDAVMSLFSIKVSNATLSTTDTYEGTASIQTVSANSLNSITSNFTIPSGKTLTLRADTAGSLVTLEYLSATSMSVSDTRSPNSGTRKVDGTVRISTGPDTRTLAIKGLTPVAGTVSSGAISLFTPTSGVIDTTDVGANIATSATLSGINTQVSGDTDRDGSKDMTFTALTSSLPM